MNHVKATRPNPRLSLGTRGLLSLLFYFCSLSSGGLQPIGDASKPRPPQITMNAFPTPLSHSFEGFVWKQEKKKVFIMLKFRKCFRYESSDLLPSAPALGCSEVRPHLRRVQPAGTFHPNQTRRESGQNALCSSKMPSAIPKN